MSNLMYEINWHWISIGDDESVFNGCDVTPIYILDKNYLAPEATKTTILAKDSRGNKFTGNINNYYETETEAWNKIKEELTETLRLYKSEIALLTKQCTAIEKFMEKIK